MNRFYTIIVLLFVSIPFFAQGNFPKELTNLSSAKKYFSEHILDLDPIEGIYDFENVVQASSGRYVGSRKQHCTIVILDLKKVKSKIVSDKFVYTAYSVSGDIDGFVGGINTISKGSYYTFSRFNEKGDLLTFRFELENNISFKIIDRAYFGDASRHIVTTAIKSYPTVQMYANATRRAIEEAQPKEWTGTGFALTNNYIVTNNHVVEGAKTINIQGINGVFNHKYNAEVVSTDKVNDLAIIKVNGITIPSASIPYAVKVGTAEVGEEVFVLGYPLTSTMGEEIKLTTGVISSKTGFQGDVSIYQISAPIQPGNSGGPLFDSKGNVIGIVSAKHKGAENVGYAIKTSYLKNLMESTVSSNILPQTNKLSTLNLAGKVKAVKNYVYYITCSSVGSQSSKSTSSIVSPHPASKPSNMPVDPQIIIKKIISNMVSVQGGDIMTNQTGNDSLRKIYVPSFSIGRYEVTQEEWLAIMQTYPSRQILIGNKIPIHNLSWDDCQVFVRRLNSLSNKKFRLPTDVEWEYAARGGQKSHNYKYAGSDEVSNVAWYTNNCDRIHTVGEKSPNELGLYDMSGNLTEWCQDKIENSQIKEFRWTPGSSCIIRGGSWGSNADECSVSLRKYISPIVHDGTLGFRLVLE